MNEDRMPTLFEILNRYSKPPVDLWSFYIFLKEQYGGAEYLEFWLDCSAHLSLVQEVDREIAATGNSRGAATRTPASPSHVSYGNSRNGVSPPQQTGVNRESQTDSAEQDDQGNSSGDTNSRFRRFFSSGKRNKTTSRFSDVLNDMQMPDYPEGVATSPTRGSPSRGSPTRNAAELPLDDPFVNRVPFWPEDSDELDRYFDFPFRSPPQTPPPKVALAAGTNNNPGGPALAPPINPHHPADPTADSEESRPRESFAHSQSQSGSQSHLPMNSGNHSHSQSQSNSNRSHGHSTSSNSNRPYWGQGPGMAHKGIMSPPTAELTRVQNSALHIMYTYLAPDSTRAIELPTLKPGWTMANEVLKMSTSPKGLEDRTLFRPAMDFVFDLLEREALPAFLMNRALSNVQPVSATLRLVGGLIGLFGGFWLSFVFILLDWQPKYVRCWVILPFGIGWYLFITSLYHIDPILALVKMSERDGGGFSQIQSRFVHKMLLKRSLFALTFIVLLSAAFIVLFVFVPGYRL